MTKLESVNLFRKNVKKLQLIKKTFLTFGPLLDINSQFIFKMMKFISIIFDEKPLHIKQALSKMRWKSWIIVMLNKRNF